MLMPSTEIVETILPLPIHYKGVIDPAGLFSKEEIRKHGRVDF